MIIYQYFRVVLLALCLLLCSCAHLNTGATAESKTIYGDLFNNKNQPTQNLVDLLALSGYAVDGKTPSQDVSVLVGKLKVVPSASPLAILNLVQKIWLRKPGQERWEQNTTRSLSQQKAVIRIFTKLGFLSSVTPAMMHAKGAIILSGRVSSVQFRSKSVKQLLDSGHSFSKLWVLSGERKLAAVEKKALSNSKIDDERGMTKIIVETMLPTLLPSAHFIDAEMKPNKTRANTLDTLEAFFKEKPPGGKYFLVSSQPFGIYQQLIAELAAKRAQRHDIQFFLVAEADKAILQTKDVVLLDNLARVMYVLNQMNSLSS